MREMFVIRRYGALPHSTVHLETRRTIKPRPDRELNQNGPVIVKMKDGKRLSTPEVISISECESELVHDSRFPIIDLRGKAS
jgi:hypothetical protein